MASVDLDRAVEGTVGLVLLTVALAWAAVVVVRHWRARRDAQAEEPGGPALARFADVQTSDPEAFGGGAPAGRLRRRQDTVTYGYLAVAEEYGDPESDAVWCTLTVTLPGRVPFLVLDHWRAVGRPNVPHPAPLRPRLKDAEFDSAYVVGVEDPDVLVRVLGPGARRVLLDAPLQRLLLRGSALMVRTFDGVQLDGVQLDGVQLDGVQLDGVQLDDVQLDDARIAAMTRFVERFLSATPSFVRTTMAAAGPLRPEDPLPEGLYGPDEA